MATNGEEDSAKWLYVRTAAGVKSCACRGASLSRSGVYCSRQSALNAEVEFQSLVGNPSYIWHARNLPEDAKSRGPIAWLPKGV